MELPVKRPYWLITFILLIIGISRDRGNNKKQKKIDRKYGIKYDDAYSIFLRSPEIIIKEHAEVFIKKRVEKRRIKIIGPKAKIIYKANRDGDSDEKNFFYFSKFIEKDSFSSKEIKNWLQEDVDNITI